MESDFTFWLVLKRRGHERESDTWLRSWWGWRRGSVSDLALELELRGKVLLLLLLLFFLENPLGYRREVERSKCCFCCCCWCCLKSMAAAMACSRIALSSSCFFSLRIDVDDDHLLLEAKRCFFALVGAAACGFRRAQRLPIIGLVL